LKVKTSQIQFCDIQVIKYLAYLICQKEEYGTVQRLHINLVNLHQLYRFYSNNIFVQVRWPNWGVVL